jgi:hypothetical protein
MPGDIICQFWIVEAGAVLRPHGNGSYRYIGRAVIVGNAEEWDKPTDINSFNSTRVLALPMSLNELIHLSFDAVNLTVPPDTHFGSDPSPTGLLSWIAEEINDWKWAICCLNILLVLAKSLVKGKVIWEWVFSFYKVYRSCYSQCFSFEKIGHAYCRFCYIFFERPEGGWGTGHYLLFLFCVWHHHSYKGFLGRGVSYHYLV